METYTTDNALAAMGFGKFQALVLVYAGMGWVAESMELNLLSTCLLFSALFATGMGFISALSPNYLCLMALRFLVGVGVGGGHVFSSWFLEFVPAQNRGTWMIVFSFFWTLGTVLEASLALVVIPALSWRWLLAFTALPCFLLLPFFGITPESPRYLCAQNRMSDATLVLERISKTNQEALPPGILTYNHGIEVDHNAPTYEIDHLLPVKEKKCTDDNAMSSKSGSVAALRSLLSQNLRRSTLLLWFVFYANTFAYYGLVLLTSQLSDANISCASGLRYVKSEQDASLYKDTFITSLAEFPGLIVSAVLVEWLGRKATMWCLLFTCCGFLGPLVFHQTELWTTALLFGARACAMGSFTVLCLYAPEVYPTSVRSTGVGIANAIGRIGGIVCPLVAVGMLRSCHQMEAIVVFEVVLCLAAIACMLFPVETKGRDMN
ncbi:hypothetical protein ACQ4PT_054552 [Festuca glaucescens]